MKMSIARCTGVLALASAILSGSAKADTIYRDDLNKQKNDVITSTLSSPTELIDTAPGKVDRDPKSLTVVLTPRQLGGGEGIVVKDPFLDDLWFVRRIPGATFSMGSMGGRLHPSAGPVPINTPDRAPISAPEPGSMGLVASGMAAVIVLLLRRPLRNGFLRRFAA
jgi:hypothetical protein